jgi:molecular chaperone GrpE
MPSSPGSDAGRQPQPQRQDQQPGGGPGESPPAEAAAAGSPAAEAAVAPAEPAVTPEQLAQMEDRYKRALADLDNYRKRSAREADRRVAESREALLREWLEAIDSVERALRLQPDNRALFEGLRSVLDQMEAILARNGVTRVGTAGERFDPERHEAIAVQPNDEVADHTVLETARSGFAMGDRVLRPAQVVVSRRDGQQP